MRAAGASYKVAKNRLATLALDGSSFEGVKPLLKGPTALAWSHDPVAVAKTAVDFARTNEKFVVLGGAIGGQTLDAAGVKALSELPSLATLRAGLLGMLQTPATRIAGVLAAPAGGLARVLAAHARKDGEPEEAAAA
jgi:large subunit ribosomal protein L10